MQSRSGISIAVCLAVLLFGSVIAAPQTTPQPASSDNASNSSPESSSPPATDSQVRIVRLSQVQGAVEIDRNTGEGFQPALLNFPITEGVQLRTGKGLAEVEFEDNSTLRLTPDSQVVFSQLQRRESGATASTVTVEAGTVYVTLARTKGSEFTLACGSRAVRLQPSSHIRLSAETTEAGLAVLGGKIQVEEPVSVLDVGKDKTVVLDRANPGTAAVNKGVAPGAYDTWDKAAADYHGQRVKLSTYGNAPPKYGLNDMRYYGHYISECGQLVWRPYFASAAWDPFANGTWVWFPGTGYTWVSPYPWGWTPYHYGGWDYCPDYGWGWRPRGAWNGLRNVPPNARQPRHGHRPPPGGGPPRPPRPPKPPGPGTPPKAITVNRTPPVVSGLRSPSKFVIEKDSAGLGIPRSVLGNLGHVSQQIQEHGSATAAVRPGSVIAGNAGEPRSMHLSAPEKTSRTEGSMSHPPSNSTSYSKGIASQSQTGRAGGGHNGSSASSGSAAHSGNSGSTSGGIHSGGSGYSGGGHSGGSSSFGGSGGSHSSGSGSFGGGGASSGGGGGGHSGAEGGGGVRK